MELHIITVNFLACLRYTAERETTFFAVISSHAVVFIFGSLHSKSLFSNLRGAAQQREPR